VSVEVAPSAVVVLGGSRVGVTGHDLSVTERDAGVKGVGDRRMPQRMWADVPWDAGGLGDASHHPVNVAPFNRPPGTRAQDQRPCGTIAAAGLQNRSTGTVSGMVAGLLPFPMRWSTR
jgi:hypothetical protein